MLLFATGLSLSDILTTAFFAWIVVVCGLIGALVPSVYKWAFLVFAVMALFYVWYVFLKKHIRCFLLTFSTHRSSLLGHGPRTTFNAGGSVRTGYIRGSGFVAFITMFYPIAWGCSEGGNVISPTGEMIWYGILDLILGPLFLYYYCFALRNTDYGAFGFHSGKYSDGPYGNPGGYGTKGPTAV